VTLGSVFCWAGRRRAPEGGVDCSMRHVLQGALGAGLLYPLIWYGSAPDPVDVVGSTTGLRKIVEAGTAAREAPSSASAPSGPGVPRPESGTEHSRQLSRRIDSVPGSAASATVADVSLPSAPVPPSVAFPRVSQPTEPAAAMPLPPALPELLSRVSDVQQSAGDPTELAKRVQMLDADPAELAQLKAFADKFVRLPASAADRYTPVSQGSSPAAPRRR
jgi:hypothetical protein